MKNLFEIDSNEIKRILSLHEESTKNQYLNVISEQTNKDGVSFTLSNNVRLENEISGQSELELPKGAFFKIGGKNLLYTKTNYLYVGTVFHKDGGKKPIPGVILYRCNTGKYNVKGNENVKYYSSKGDNPGLNELAKNLCAKSQNFVPKNKKTKQSNVVNKSKVKTGTVSTPGTATKSGTVSTPSQLVDTVKQIETNIGIPTPTGQMTDVAIDALIAKLSE